jgi:mevalonate kinase
MSAAPGKIILFGEHAVVYGRPALAVPVSQVQANVEIKESSRAGTWIHAPGIDLHAGLESLPQAHPLRVTVTNTLAALGVASVKDIEIHIQSSIPVASGLGSGAAVSVALIRALAEYCSHPINNELTNQLAYETEKLLHGTPSGIDNTVITYARPVYYIKDQPIQTFHVAQPFTIVIGNTGLPAPTKESVGDVRSLWQADPQHWEQVFDKVGEIARSARRAIEIGDIPALGPLMNANHALLQQMTVSCNELDGLVQSALAAGAAGAKLSGGGRGGNMIALAGKNNAPAIAEALTRAGARHVIVTEVGKLLFT